MIVVEGHVPLSTLKPEELDLWLKKALETHSLKEAVDLVSKAFGLSKREVYQHALQLKSEKTRLS